MYIHTYIYIRTCEHLHVCADIYNYVLNMYLYLFVLHVTYIMYLSMYVYMYVVE